MGPPLRGLERATWDIETVDSGQFTGSNSSVALDQTTGYPRISYRDAFPSAPRLKYASWNGTSWDIEVIGTANAFETSLALDLTTGYPQISYYHQNQPVFKLEYAAWNGAAWNGASWDITVVDNGNSRVQKFAGNGNYVSQWGGLGTANGLFNGPNGIAIDAAGDVYVVDTNNNRVQKFNSSGAFLTQWGSGGSGNSQFFQARGVAIDAAGSVYVADAGNNRIQKFDSTGGYLTQWGSAGAGNGNFSFPIGVAVDGDGNVYVSDTLNHRVQKFTSSRAYLGQWGSNGTGDGEFNQPTGVAVDRAGNVYVNDALNHRVQKFTSSGGYLGQWGSTGAGDGEFNQPTGVAVDAEGTVFVADSQNDRVQVFVPARSAVLDDGQSEDFILPPGSYLVSELVPDGWTMDGIVCDGGSPDYGATTVGLTLVVDDDVTCTFDNLAPPTTGTITIVKDADPADGTTFNFTDDIEAPNAFALSSTTTLTQTFSSVPTGSYTVTESDTPGWPLTDLQCSYDLSTVTPSLRGGSVSVGDLAAGDTVVCTFTNSQCQPGQYDGGGNACVPAPAGSFVDQPGATQPTQCAPGTWQDQQGAISCKPADPGFFVPTPGATQQTQCPQGTTSEAGATECTPIQSAGFCPLDPGVDTLRTDLIGIGLRSRSARLTVPNYGDVESLYGQLAAVDIGVIKWVQFLQKGESPTKVAQTTSPAVDPATVRWWGTDLSADPAARWVRGLFTFGKNGARSPRAFVLWPTYDTNDETYANTFETFDSPGNYVHQSTITQTLSLPPTAAAGADVTVNVALVDVNYDRRVVILTVEAGGVSETRTINRPNRRNALNVETFSLSGVAAGTDEVTITLESPPVGGAFRRGGDSAAIIGASANYACGEVSPP
jgi:uncharacterized protein YjiK